MKPTSCLYDALIDFYVNRMTWLDIRHVQTLCWMIIGIIHSGTRSLNGVYTRHHGRSYAHLHQRRFRRWIAGLIWSESTKAWWGAAIGLGGASSVYLEFGYDAGGIASHRVVSRFIEDETIPMVWQCTQQYRALIGDSVCCVKPIGWFRNALAVVLADRGLLPMRAWWSISKTSSMALSHPH